MWKCLAPVACSLILGRGAQSDDLSWELHAPPQVTIQERAGRSVVGPREPIDCVGAVIVSEGDERPDIVIVEIRDGETVMGSRGAEWGPSDEANVYPFHVSFEALPRPGKYTVLATSFRSVLRPATNADEEDPVVEVIESRSDPLEVLVK